MLSCFRQALKPSLGGCKSAWDRFLRAGTRVRNWQWEKQAMSPHIQKFLSSANFWIQQKLGTNSFSQRNIISSSAQGWDLSSKEGRASQFLASLELETISLAETPWQIMNAHELSKLCKEMNLLWFIPVGNLAFNFSSWISSCFNHMNAVCQLSGPHMRSTELLLQWSPKYVTFQQSCFGGFMDH